MVALVISPKFADTRKHLRVLSLAKTRMSDRATLALYYLFQMLRIDFTNIQWPHFFFSFLRFIFSEPLIVTENLGWEIKNSHAGPNMTHRDTPSSHDGTVKSHSNTCSSTLFVFVFISLRMDVTANSLDLVASYCQDSLLFIV